MNPLTNRFAIITGANQGFGKAIAEAYVKAGASLLVTARGEDQLRAVVDELNLLKVDDSQTIHHLKADVSNGDDCNRTVEFAATLCDRIHILVNNAGIYGPMGPIEENDWEHWVEAMAINCFGTILMCRSVMAHFRRHQYGKIINLSGGGATAPMPNLSAYATSKAAVVRFTETLAGETQAAKIDVNAIAPGALNTRLLDEVLAAGPQKVGAGFYQRSLKQQESGGAGMVKGAELAVFLGSGASDGITGRLLSAIWDDWMNLPAQVDQLQKSDVFTLRRIVPEDRKEWRAA